MARNNLLKLTFGLILVNLLLASLAVFNYYSAKIDVAKIVGKPNAVLGANTNIPKFDKNYIISDQTFSSTRVFDTEEKVQAYLDNANSPLKNYTEQGKRASYWIFASARGQTSSKWGVVPNLNPGLIMAYLEKEQSLLSLNSYDVNKDPENRIRTAMGYGCPDTSVCSTDYYGFANQVNWASYQLQFNFNLAISGNSLVAPYIVNKTITTLDEYNVFLTNAATAANYRYTPHVYWGNYNLWAIIVSNGWGVDSTTFSRADLDAQNLVNKDSLVAVSNLPNVSFDSVKNLLTATYSLGDVSDNIKLVQTYLRQEGYYLNRDISGLYGVITDQALQNYIRDKKLGISGKDNLERCTVLINTNFNIGDISEDVRSLQQCLRSMGLFNWPTNTGYFGTITLAAQTQARATTTGGNNSNTANVAANTDNSCSSLKTQSYSLGETSDRVKLLQGCMRAIGLFNYASDTGYFGPVTQASLKSWLAQSVENTYVPSSSSANSSSCDSYKQKSFNLGDTGGDVEKLQQCLRSSGLFNWPTNTGYFGPVTAEAFAKFKGGSSPQFSCSDLKTQVYNFGETNNRVVQLQNCMKQAGTFNWAGGSTGYFGDVTKAAIIAWRGYF